MIDDDLATMQRNELYAEAMRLRGAIRNHRDQKGDDRCWLDDEELYETLPEQVKADDRLPVRDEFLANCARFHDTRQRRPDDPLRVLKAGDKHCRGSLYEPIYSKKQNAGGEKP